MTALLQAWRAGDDGALRRLVPLVEGEMRRLARGYMRGERAGHSLQATALVNEAYLRLVGLRKVQWQDRAHFLAMSARVMRRVLVDHARSRRYQKRNGDAIPITLAESADLVDERPAALIALDDALTVLAAMDARKAQVVELRFFGGLGVQEVAHALGVSTDTVSRDWKLARAWLKRELTHGERHDP